jgi:hypothetical protein
MEGLVPSCPIHPTTQKVGVLGSSHRPGPIPAALCENPHRSHRLFTYSAIILRSSWSLLEKPVLSLGKERLRRVA